MCARCDYLVAFIIARVLMKTNLGIQYVIKVEDHGYSTALGLLLMSWIKVENRVAILAEILLRSPRKLFIFLIKKYIYRIKVSNNKMSLNLILKETSLVEKGHRKSTPSLHQQD